jgi:hypothetical protein
VKTLLSEQRNSHRLSFLFKAIASTGCGLKWLECHEDFALVNAKRGTRHEKADYANFD